MSISITDVLAYLQRHHASLGITLYPPANEAEVLAFEQRKGVRLPAEVQAFYSCCNGLEVERDMLRLIPLAEILENDPDSYLASPHDFHIAEVVIYCDTWTLSVNPLAPDEYTIYASTQTVLTTSFAKFLEVAMHHGAYGDGGLYDWQKLISQPNSTILPPDLVNSPRMEELDQLAERIRQKLTLTYDAEGVKFVEGFIERNKGSVDPDEWSGLVNSLGAFLGRCIILNYGGEWQHDPEFGVCVAFDEKNKVYPFAKTRKQFESGLEDSIYSFYTIIPAIYNRPTPARKPWYKFW